MKKKTLVSLTAATQIHGKTQQEIGTCVLEAGTEYTPLTRRTDELGFTWQRIEIEGYLYEIEAD